MNLFPQTEDCSAGVIIGEINSSSIKGQKNDWRMTSTTSTSSTKSTSTLVLALIFSL